jgi:hypothetical protein
MKKIKVDPEVTAVRARSTVRELTKLRDKCAKNLNSCGDYSNAIGDYVEWTWLLDEINGRISAIKGE